MRHTSQSCSVEFELYMSLKLRIGAGLETEIKEMPPSNN